LASFESDAPLNPERCAHLITCQLQAQGWGLLSPEQLLRELWPEVQAIPLTVAEVEKLIRVHVWRRYATHLHELCGDPTSPQYEQAWAELWNSLNKQARSLVYDSDERENLLQETMEKLQQRLSSGGIEHPHALFVYASQVLRNRHIDNYRRRDAAERGGLEEVPIEETNDGDEDSLDWQETMSTDQPGQRTTEEEVAQAQTADQLRAFFRRYLQSELQQQVAELSFIEGLEPMEIADRLQKSPHEIRMAKGRMVQALRSLPPEAQRLILEIMGTDDE
jgi:RNA polymerase sigma factor (sigma-70 family)